jgi:diaminopimelate epimerase
MHAATQLGPMRFAKGHGTGNDFVLLPDPDGALRLDPALVQAVCDRRFGIGGDGVLRVVRSAAEPEAATMAGVAPWFMDYRNSDGSPAEMCGNGARVFARYLVQSGWADEGREFMVATRAGVVQVRVAPDAVSVQMPYPQVGKPGVAWLGGQPYPGIAVDVGNPHLVCRLPDRAAVDRLDLTTAPGFDADVFDRGANLELFAGTDPAPANRQAAELGGSLLQVRMRVYERGSGETLSCGTGACAVAAVAARDAGLAQATVEVSLPGGHLLISLDADRCTLTGPAVVVADGDLTPALIGRSGA